RTAHQPVEEAPVEVLKNFFQVIVLAGSSGNPLASAHLPDQAHLLSNCLCAGELGSAPHALHQSLFCTAWQSGCEVLHEAPAPARPLTNQRAVPARAPAAGGWYCSDC